MIAKQLVPSARRYHFSVPRAAAMAVLITVAIAMALATMPERPADYVALFRQNVVVRLLVADLTIALSTGIVNAVALFFYIGQLGLDRAEASALILIAYGGAFAGTPLFTRLANRLGRRARYRSAQRCRRCCNWP